MAELEITGVQLHANL